MRNSESLKELVEALKAEAGQLTDVLRSAFRVPPPIPPRERLEKANHALRAAGIVLSLQDNLGELKGVMEKTEVDRDRFERAMRERGALN